MNSLIQSIYILLPIAILILILWSYSPLKSLLIAIINTIYGILLLLTLTNDTPGFYLVLIIGLVLSVMGLVGFALWTRNFIRDCKNELCDETAIKSWFSLIRSFDIVLIIGLLFRAFILQPYLVEGSSMEPNFHDREIMLVDKITYRFQKIQRGDILIFHAPKNPGDDYIKRVVGLPGETIVINQGNVFINGMLVNESYLALGTQTKNSGNVETFRQTLGSNDYFVLGDNRSNSSDSREWGVLPKINVVGRAWFIILPWNNHGFVKHNPATIQANKLLKDMVTSFNFSILSIKS